MEKIKIVRESDFSEVEVEFPKKMLELAEEVRRYFSDIDFIPKENGEIVILVEDKEVDRYERELTGKGKYIITIKQY